MAVNILLKRSATASKRPVGASMAFGELNLNYDAATGGLYYKDSLGAVVKVGPCQVSATAPNASPAGSAGNSAGEFWFDTATQTLKVYNGTAWVEAGGSVQGVTGTAPITVDNSDPFNPVVGVDAASTTAPGVVQLNDTTTSSSTTEALTANQGRVLQTQIDALAVSSNLVFAGTIDASTGDMVTVSTEGTAAGFTVGDPLPSPAAGNTEFFAIVTVPGTMTPPGGSAQECHQGDWWLSDGSVWNFLDIGYNAPYATTSAPGVVQLATDAEVQAGVNTDHVVTPSGLQSKLSDSVISSSSTTIASSLAVKDAYDAGFQGQTDAAAAQSSANAAQADATQALSDAAAAQSTANQAVIDAAAAQSDATQALSDAAAAQATADAAMPKAGGNFTGNVTFDNATVLTLDPGSTFFMDGTSSVSGGTTFVNGSNTIFDTGSTTEVNGSFTFNASPTFAIGVDIGPAVKVTFDNTVENILTATEVQGAIDEVTTSYLNKGGGAMTGNLYISNSELQVDFTGTFTSAGTATFTGTTDLNGATSFFFTPTWLDNIGPASQVTYDNTASGLTAIEVQAAIDELAGQVDGVQSVSGTAPITVDNTDAANPVVGIDAASTTAPGAVQLNDTVTSTSDTEAATANAVKTAYDAANAAQVDATQALAEVITAQTDATQALADAAAAQATADAALPKAGGTMIGDITFFGTGNGIVFQDASTVEAISDSVSTTSSIVAASSTAVKAAYDAAIAAQAGSPMTSATVLYVNVTTGNNSTAARGTAKPFATITAALAAASEGDTIFVAPGTYVESPTLSKGVNLVGTFTDQAILSGPKVSGTFTVSITGALTRNWAVSNFQFQASSAGNNSVVVSNNSFGSGGLGSFTNCFFQQFSSASLTEQCFATSGTWTRSLYLRNCTFDGNFTHNAGTTAGASGYIVIDNLLGIAGNDKYYKIMTGTCEFRNPSNALAPVLHTGGFAVFSNVLSWISNVAATTTVFGGTGFAYKGTSAGLGQCVAYFTGQGCNVVEGSTWGKLSIGTNVVYAFGNVNYDTSLATLSGIPLTVAAPNPNGVLASMARPQWNYLTTSSSVTAANQLGVVLDSTNGNVYTVTSFDAGTY